MSKETTKASVVKKIKCFRSSDNKEIWLNPSVAYNKARQRQMGFFPEAEEGPKVEPLDEDIIDKTGEDPAEDDSPELDGLGDDDTGGDDGIQEDNQDEPDETVEDSAEENQEDTPPAGDATEENKAKESAPEEPKPLNKVMQNLHNAYKEKFGKFPPRIWRQKTIKKKLNG